MRTILAMPEMQPTEEADALTTPESSLMTVLGIAEGDVLEYLEGHGAASLYRVIQTQEWPSSMVIMAVGALIRQGLIRGDQRRLEPVHEGTSGQDVSWHAPHQSRYPNVSPELSDEWGSNTSLP